VAALGWMPYNTQVRRLRYPLCVGFVALSGLLLACSTEDSDRAPGLTNFGGNTGAGAPAGGSVPSGSAGDTGEPPVSEGTSNRVRTFTGDAFSETAELISSAEVHLINAAGDDYTSVNYDGDEFVLVEEDQRQDGWLVVDASDASIMSTVTRHDTTETVIAPAMPRAVLDDILTSLGIEEVQPNAAHLVVRLVDSSGDGVANVEPIVTGGVNPLLIRDTTRWTNFDTLTTEDGLFLSYNIPTVSLPGTNVRVILGGALSEEFDARLVGGAITVMTVVVSG